MDENKNQDYNEQLLDVRKDIDAIDKELLPLFIERMKCSERVAKIKMNADIPILNAQREMEIIEAIRNKAGEYGDYAADFYTSIIKISRERQVQMITPSDTTDLQPVIGQDQIKSLCAIADIVWHETYDPILPKGQTDYMVETFQSESAVKEQMQNQGYMYYLIRESGMDAGFFAIVPNYNDENAMFLSKIYTLSSFRGKGLVRKVFSFIIEKTKEQGFSKIFLTVNKNNTHAIEVYEHLGFHKVDEVVTDIGGGYVMDDNIMEYYL